MMMNGKKCSRIIETTVISVFLTSNEPLRVSTARSSLI